MISFMAGYPMLVKDNAIEQVVRALKQAGKQEDILPGHEPTILLLIEGDGIDASQGSVSGNDLVISEADYLDADYLSKRQPRPFDGTTQGPRRDAVFREPLDILDTLRPKLVAHLQGEMGEAPEIEQAANKMVDRAAAALSQ